MKTNPVLEEVWRTKDELAREAGCDVHRFFEGLRRWSTENPHHGRVIRNAGELRRLAEEEECQKAARSSLVLNDKPPTEPGSGSCQ